MTLGGLFGDREAALFDLYDALGRVGREEHPEFTGGELMLLGAAMVVCLTIDERSELSARISERVLGYLARQGGRDAPRG